jgi:ribonuclease-3
LDGGLEAAHKVILHVFVSMTANLTDPTDRVADYKSTLQELLQKNSRESAIYTIIHESGPPHKKNFTSQVSHMGRILGEGSGRNKKEAEQNAAMAALTDARKKV